MGINLNDKKIARYFDVQDITNKELTNDNFLEIEKTIPLTVTKIKQKDNNGTNVFTFECVTDNENATVIYNKISFSDSDLGWNFHKDFLQLTDALKVIDAENYDVENLVGFTFNGTFGFNKNKFFDKTNEKSQRFHYELKKVAPFS